MTTIKYEIRNRFTNQTQFVAEIEADENTSWRVKIGLAVKWAFRTNADLSGADLSGAVLSGADLSDAPKIPNIHQAIYAAASQPGALDMGDWHTCETTHCRAGWAVTLAGEAGKALEEKLESCAAAATLIYLASDPSMENFPSFYSSNATALADMKLRAEEEAAKAETVQP